MTSPSAKTKETSAITPRQKFERHTDSVRGVVHLPGGERIITCSEDSSLRVWNLKSGKQIGEDWRDGESKVKSIALSPDGKKVASGKQIREDWRDEESKVWMNSLALSPNGKKVVSGSSDGAVRLWDIDTCKVIAKWTGHTQPVASVYWSQDGQRVLSGSLDGTARQWEVECGETRNMTSEETILASIKTGHHHVWAVVYSPDMTSIATAGWDWPEPAESSIQIWDAKTGKLVATLKGHTRQVYCLAWTKDGKTLISGSYDCSIRTWNTTKWEQIAILVEHTSGVYALAISPNDRILASASGDRTTRLWNLDNINGKPISLPLQHAEQVNCVSFSAGGNLLATGCRDKNAYLWDIAAIIKEAGLDELLSPSKVS
jgi:WD40 repeat protein